MREMSEKLYPVQEAALDILEKLKEICDKNELKYMLIEDSALGVYAREGLLPWVYTLTVGMSKVDYDKFIDACNEDEKLISEGYYVMCHDNTPQFNEFTIRFAKRSRVVLPKDRKEDQKYYDFFIVVKPIYYSGNSSKECKGMEKAYRSYIQAINSRPLNKNALKRLEFEPLNFILAYKYKRLTGNEYSEMEVRLNKISERTRFVFIPEIETKDDNNVGYCNDIKYYENPVKIDFYGIETYTVAHIEEYVQKRYGKNLDRTINKRVERKSELMGPEFLRRLQLIQLDIFCEFDRICRKHNIKYMLGAGTALGAKRHGGFIPWDDDMDAFMMYDEYLKFLEVADSEIDHDIYFLKTQKSDKDCNLVFSQLKRNNTVYSKGGRKDFETHPGILIDILPIMDAPKNPILHKIQDRICKFYKTMTWAHIGAHTYKPGLKKKYYMWLAKTDNKKAYEKYIKWATMTKKETGYMSFYDIVNNFMDNPVNHKKTHTELTQMKFEGHEFYITKNLENYLSYAYSKEYMRYPIIKERVPKHSPAEVDLGGLHPYE